MISTGLPYLQFSMNSQGFSSARLAWPAYDGGRKCENSSAWKHRIIVASTCRRSVEFGRYVSWLWLANCVSVMTKMLHLYNFAILCHGRPCLKNVTKCARNSRTPCLIGWIRHAHSLKGALYRIWCGVNRLGDSGVKVVWIDSAIFQLLLSRRVSYC